MCKWHWLHYYECWSNINGYVVCNISNPLFCKIDTWNTWYALLSNMWPAGRNWKMLWLMTLPCKVIRYSSREWTASSFQRVSNLFMSCKLPNFSWKLCYAKSPQANSCTFVPPPHRRLSISGNFEGYGHSMKIFEIIFKRGKDIYYPKILSVSNRR